MEEQIAIPDKLSRIGDYAEAYVADHGFEDAMFAARRRLVMETIRAVRPRSVVEVGCGPELLVDTVVADPSASGALTRWVVVEPVPRFAEAASSHRLARRAGEESSAAGDGSAAEETAPLLRVVAGFVEDETAAILDICGGPPDLVVCSSVLHEVPDVGVVLKGIARLCGPATTLHVNVPSATSLHRRLGVVLGAASDAHQLSARNASLHQYRVFDLPSLADAVRRAGLAVAESGGCFLKPFTHEQMGHLDFVDDAMLDALYEIGRQFPELAAVVYVNAGVG